MGLGEGLVPAVGDGVASPSISLACERTATIRFLIDVR